MKNVGAQRGRFDVVFAPRVHNLASNEGLLVLLFDLTKALNRVGVPVQIHTTDRHLPRLQKLLHDHGIERDATSVKVHSVGSYGLVRGAPGERKAVRAGARYRAKKLMLRSGLNFALLLRRAMLWLLDGPRSSSLVRLAFVIPLAFVMSIVAIPIVIAFAALAVFASLKKVFAGMLRRGIRLLRRLGIPPAVRRAVQLLRRAKRLVTENLQSELYRGEQRRVADALNRDESVHALFFFSAFEGGIVSKLSKPTLVVFPDAVTALFPTRYLSASLSDQLRQIKEAIQHATALVCYSVYVETVQLRSYFGSELGSKRVHVIPQGYFQGSDPGALSGERDIAERLNAEHQRVVNPFPNLLLTAPQARFGTFQYLLYPTIDRPHKNTVTLLRALRILVRERHMNLKVVLTTPALTIDVNDFIIAERLQYDVLCMPSVPTRVLDLLFQGAALTVHPSLAEGGDIFNFSRAVSNNCPALVSDASMCREMFTRGEIPEDVYENWMFDPVDSAGLAAKIAESLAERPQLLQSQKEALGSLQVYDYDQMALRYLNAYQELLPQ